MTRNYPLPAEIISYLRKNRMWWLLPIILLLALTSLLIFVAQATSPTPFIYILF